MASNGITSSTASTSSHPQPSPQWIASIDAVYSLFEDPSAAAKYPHLAQKVKNAVELCEQVIHEVGQEHCALSFNGGKDCTVLVHILAAVLRRINRSGGATLVRIPSMYITCPSPFPTVEKFIEYSVSPVHGYNLDLVSLEGGMKQGLRTYLDGGGQRQVGITSNSTKSQPPSDAEEAVKPREIQAIFIGTRRDDPHGPQLSARSWTDNDWPRVERIHPILEWTYQDVWQFLRCPHLASNDEALGMSRSELAQRYGTAGGGSEGVPYCLLYDQGYTSLGSTYNTLPNPELRIDGANDDDDAQAPVVVGDGTAKGRWRPAYMLEDGKSERAGRVENSTAPKPTA